MAGTKAEPQGDVQYLFLPGKLTQNEFLERLKHTLRIETELITYDGGSPAAGKISGNLTKN
jgi:hypothetical protein